MLVDVGQHGCDVNEVVVNPLDVWVSVGSERGECEPGFGFIVIVYVCMKATLLVLIFLMIELVILMFLGT